MFQTHTLALRAQPLSSLPRDLEEIDRQSMHSWCSTLLILLHRDRQLLTMHVVLPLCRVNAELQLFISLLGSQAQLHTWRQERPSDYNRSHHTGKRCRSCKRYKGSFPFYFGILQRCKLGEKFFFTPIFPLVDMSWKGCTKPLNHMSPMFWTLKTRQYFCSSDGHIRCQRTNSSHFKLVLTSRTRVMQNLLNPLFNAKKRVSGFRIGPCHPFKAVQNVH